MVGASSNNTSSDISTIAQLIAPRGTITYPLTLSTAGTGVANDQIRMTFNYGTGFSATAYMGSLLENVSTAATSLVFGTYGANFAERMRITSDGKVYIGISSLPSPGTFNAYTNNTTPAGRFVAGPSQPDGNITLLVDKYSSTNTTSQWFLGFTISNQSTASGVITANGASQAAFGSWSDYRLKENIVDLPNQLSNILALRPVEFDYIKSEGGGHQISFIAQEFEEIYPDAVGQRPDGMKTLTGWGKTEAILVKAIQEQQVQIEELKTLLKA
jgi:hypothetical protein